MVNNEMVNEFIKSFAESKGIAIEKFVSIEITVGSIKYTYLEPNRTVHTIKEYGLV
jgi:hypothetical protein